jgi:lipopolysaccharide transport system ATP-binding protein
VTSVAIGLEGVSKRFRRGAGRNTLKDFVQDRLRGRRGEEFWALSDVTFDVDRGSTVGLIGANGSGKTTLLRLVSGLGKPTRGAIRRQDEVAAILSLGDTFDPMLTGRENAVTAGILSGRRRRDVLRRLDEIVTFAELEEVFDDPLRTYSDGMRLRLAFSVAVDRAPGVLVVDEVLSVGDLRFQEKCFARLAELREHGTTILLASHDDGIVRRLCEQVVWLSHGRIQALGTPDDVYERYEGAMRAETERRAGVTSVADDGHERVGTFEVEISEVRVTPATIPSAGAGPTAVRLEIDLEPRVPVDGPIVTVSLHREGDYARMLDVGTDGDGVSLGRVDRPRTVVLELGRLDLPAGSYRFDVGVFERSWAYIYDYRWHAFPLVVGDKGSDSSGERSWSVRDD